MRKHRYGNSIEPRDDLQGDSPAERAAMRRAEKAAEGFSFSKSRRKR